MADITKLRVNGTEYQIRDAQASAYTDTATSALASAFDTKLEGKADKTSLPSHIVSSVTYQDSNVGEDTRPSITVDGTKTVLNLANKLEWDSNAKALKLYSGNHLLATVDGTTWVKDGMVESVAVVGNNLEITFNTDSGKEKISVPLTDVFNPDNYYNKTEIDKKFENVSISDEYITDISNVQNASGSSVLYVKTNKNAEGKEVSLDNLGNKLQFDSTINRLYLKNGLVEVSRADLSPLKGTKASVSGDTLVLA
jgi:hypothetical protein